MFHDPAERRAYVKAVMRRVYPSFRGGGACFTQALDEALAARVRPVVVEAGCGDSEILAPYRDRVGTVVALDRDGAALQRRARAQDAVQADLAAVPLADRSVDVIACEFVLEHLEEPDRVLRELGRTLREGGRMVCITPNRLNPTVLLGSILPARTFLWWHRFVLGERSQLHPLHLRANTAARIERLAARAGLRLTARVYSGNPEYTSVTKLSTWASVLWERCLDLGPLPAFKMYLVAVLEKER